MLCFVAYFIIYTEELEILIILSATIRVHLLLYIYLGPRGVKRPQMHAQMACGAFETRDLRFFGRAISPC
eukprot:scaffold7370_cov57-Phaeocystis_antarctica.AAC.1